MAVDVPGDPVRIESAEGGGFDSYLSHAGGGPATGVILVSGIFGVGEELKKMADDLAARGFTVSAPDMFWRTVPGPLTNDAAGRPRGPHPSPPPQCDRDRVRRHLPRPGHGPAHPHRHHNQ